MNENYVSSFFNGISGKHEKMQLRVKKDHVLRRNKFQIIKSNIIKNVKHVMKIYIINDRNDMLVKVDRYVAIHDTKPR